MTKAEILRVQTYLREKFGTPNLSIKSMANRADAAEVTIGDEFIGVLYRDDEDGEVSYDFNMAILEMDLSPES